MNELLFLIHVVLWVVVVELRLLDLMMMLVLLLVLILSLLYRCIVWLRERNRNMMNSRVVDAREYFHDIYFDFILECLRWIDYHYNLLYYTSTKYQ